MEDKLLKKIKRYNEDLCDGRDDLVLVTEKLVSIVSFKVQALLNTQPSRLQKEALTRYLIKTVALITELYHSVLKFLETEPPPNISDNTHTSLDLQRPEWSTRSRNLSDLFKANLRESTSLLDVSSNGPKVAKNEVILNESYIRPLDNDTLKPVCGPSNCETARISENTGVDDEPRAVPVVGNIESNELNSIAVANNTMNHMSSSDNSVSLIQEYHEKNTHTSPTFSESEVLSVTSSLAYQHPLLKFKPSAEIPRQYDTQDLDKIKENLRYLSKKMGFDSDKLSQMECEFNKDSSMLKFEYEIPMKEEQEERENIKVHTTAAEASSSESADISQNEADILQKLNTELKFTDNTEAVLTEECADVGPSSNTGAIRKQKMNENLIEFGSTTSDSESCDRVSTWLNNNTLLRDKVLDPTESNSVSDQPNTKQNSALEKLSSSKRRDRHEEAREQARKDMPEIKFVPVEVPSIIKNDLNSETKLAESSNENKNKNKESNKASGVYELKKMVPPTIGTVCVFSHIVSPHEFYLQVVNDVSTAYHDEISVNLESKFGKITSSEFKSKQEAFDRLGKFCSGYVLGDKEGWYRLQILDWELGCPAPDVRVKSIDYGFACKTSYKYLKELPADLIDIPELSVQCHLPLLYPPGSTYSSKVEEWSQETIDTFCDVVHLNSDSDYSDIRMFELILAVLEGESLAVDMIEYSEPDADSLRNMLLDFGLAVDIVDDYGNHPELGEFFEDIKELELAENLNELVLGYDATDEARICRFTRPNGTCFKGKNCKLEHIPLKDGYTTDKAVVFYTAINKPIFPMKGDTVQILVTGYIDSCTYLAQIIRNPIVKENTSLIMDKDMNDLMDAMNHPKKIGKYEHFKVYPAVGEAILAYNAPSKVWLRAVISELKYDNHRDLMAAEVYAVDFGDQFAVKMRDLRVMVEDFMHVPFQVTQIYLDKYQHRIGCDAKQAKKFFQTHISYKNFLARIKSSDTPFKVSVTTFKGRDIGPTLVQKGFAEKRTMDICIAEGHKIELE